MTTERTTFSDGRWPVCPMTDRLGFPDIEAELRNLLVDLVAGCDNIGSVTPSTLQGSLPYVRIQRFGGEDDGFTDAALVSIDAFAGDRTTARTLAEAIRQRLLTGAYIGTALDCATTATGPNEIPWSEDQEVRRFAASYRVTARR